MCDCDLTLFVKAGRDGQCLGACPQSQRVLMLAELKVEEGCLSKFKIVPVNISRPPESFRRLGLRLRLPAMHLGSVNDNEEPLDVADDIVAALESKFSGRISAEAGEDPDAELATRDLYSKFCFFLRDVCKDPGHLEAELRKLDDYLSSNDRVFLCGSKPGLLDCEVLPKLHQARVAAAAIRGYSIPGSLSGVWRYLHAAYSLPAFTRSCPTDLEITLHWLEHVGETPAKIRHFLALAGHDKSPTHSFTVPVFAKPVILE